MRFLVLPCLWSWLVIRLCVPWGGALPDELLEGAAFVLSALLLFLVGRFGLADKLLLAWEKPWQMALNAIPPFLLGWFFDISYSMPNTVPFLFLGSPMGLFCHAGNAIVFTAIVLSLVKAARDMKGLGKASGLQIIVIFVFLNAVTALYVFTSRTVYVWDNAGYWAIARTLAAETFDRDHILRILETTLSLDYNHLPAFPISLVMRLFGGNRAVFVFAVSNLYVFPALWGLTAMANGKRWSGLVLCGLFPMLTYTGLVGFVDVICCAMGIWAYLIYTSDRPAVSRGILTGALLVFSFLCRRYFIFFGASFGVAALLVKLAFRRRDWRDFLSLCCASGVCAAAFALNFLIHRVMGLDYGDIYSAYGLGLYSDFLFFCRYFGLVLITLFLVAAFVNLAKKEDRPGILFGLSQAVICFLVFVSVQTHGQQHLLLYLPALAFLALGALSRAPQYMSSFLAMALAVYCFFPKVQPATMLDIRSPDLFPSFHFYGPKRYDIDELLALCDYVDDLSARRAEPVTATVLASSFVLNTETVSSLRASLDLPEPTVKTTIQFHGTVDKRDGFNWNTAFSDYLIVGDPVQTHLGEENQQVLALLVNHILNGTGPGKAYHELPDTFIVDGNVTVRIYRRTRAWTMDEYHAISDPLQKMYPKYAELYAIPAWLN